MAKKKLEKNFFSENKLILVCGSGGVGKTTTAAAIAVKAALEGYKTLVLTIDPAKRLATSLGIESITGTPKKIDPKLLSADSNCSLDAMMLDTKSTFDELVKNYSPNKEIEKKILENSVYQHLSQMIAGSQEYMAMEKLHEVVSQNKYDVIVVDTPPTVHAVDFLEAPQRMINMINNSMMHLLLKPALFVGSSGIKFLEKGSQVILKVLDRITGFAFLQDISEMLFAFKELLGGFTQRAESVRKILQDKNTAFFLVGACEYQSIKESKTFNEAILAMNYQLKGIFMNRVYPDFELNDAKSDKSVELLTKEFGVSLAAKMVQVYQEGILMAEKADQLMKKLQNDLEVDYFIKIPLMETDVHDLAGLRLVSALI